MRDFAGLYETTLYNSIRDTMPGNAGLSWSSGLRIARNPDPVARAQSYVHESIMEGIRRRPIQQIDILPTWSRKTTPCMPIFNPVADIPEPTWNRGLLTLMNPDPVARAQSFMQESIMSGIRRPFAL